MNRFPGKGYDMVRQQPRKPKGAPNSAGGQYDTYNSFEQADLPALEAEQAWEMSHGEGGRYEQEHPLPVESSSDMGAGRYGQVDAYTVSPVRPDIHKGSRVGGDLGAIPLQFRDLAHTMWDHVRMSEANLNGADLNHAEFTHVDVPDANLTRADLSSSTIQHSDMHGMQAAGTDLTYAQVTDTDMSGADLRHAELHRAKLQNVNLSNARLDGVDFSRADTVSNVDLTGTGLTGASGTFNKIRAMNVLLGSPDTGVCRYSRAGGDRYASMYHAHPDTDAIPDLRVSTETDGPLDSPWASREAMMASVEDWGVDGRTARQYVALMDKHADYEHGVWRDTDIPLCAQTVARDSLTRRLHSAG